MPLTAHEVVDEWIDGTVGVAEPVGQQREDGHDCGLLHFDRVPGGWRRRSRNIDSLEYLLNF